MEWQPTVKLTLECEAVSISCSRKLWVQASPCAWLQLFELFAAEGLCMTGNWRVLQEQYNGHYGYSRVVARGYSMACESAHLSIGLAEAAKE